jgi:NTP pyrophosphatase (non-canonical NTP hydrolase)
VTIKIERDTPRPESQSTVSAWADATFGISSPLRAATRMNEEVAELLAKMTVSGNSPRVIAEEVADVQIVLYVLAGRLGIDLDAEVNSKMQINRARKWRLDGSGCGQHVDNAENAENAENS